MLASRHQRIAPGTSTNGAEDDKGNWFSYRIEEIAEGIYNVGRITVLP
jgi:hypothetical protein